MWQPMTLSQLAQFLANGLDSRGGLTQRSHVQAAAHLLKMKQAPYIIPEIDFQLKDALLVGVDMEWHESNPHIVTELGISVLRLPQTMLGKPIHALNDMEVHHLRLKENAHWVNGEKCEGHPEDFQFGTTCFVDGTQAKQALSDTFKRYDTRGNLRPIILFGHAVGNDIDTLREQFDFDLAALGVIVLTLDTQVMAREVGLSSGNMSLKNILGQYSVREKYLHNAGNDIAQTMVAASLLAGESVIGRGRYQPENQVDVDNLKAVLRNRSILYWGISVFCTNCDSTQHFVGQCPRTYLCTRCANNPSWKQNANTHPIEKCIRPASPCKACAKSTDATRQNDAMTHYIVDCPFEKAPTLFFVPRAFLPLEKCLQEQFKEIAKRSSDNESGLREMLDDSDE
ncbi:uncharacterized protein N0V89_008118 [Didymosphaeria variabile]|uniref:Gfd2/YDR514C-like C-terminal domain-containing protein n=1 Tax=Didymosphaeria variabile TaxID=1932322 RepID=A0A9W8XH02_9PLEO|nr:uncharacterized protein N0V89_008118 [Didymosphaeria variabile]KAJ4349502.1 hypothetical protein N0V89_008118 [Didymosphaeria variabile]